MMGFVLQMMDFVLQMMDFVLNKDGFSYEIRAGLLEADIPGEK